MITVVITGADHPTGLGTARCLQNVDCKIIGLFKNKNSFCCSSKYWDELIHYDNASDILDVLVSVAIRVKEKIFLFPTQDSVVKLVSDNREKLLDYYYFLLPEKTEVDLLLDKTKFHLWAEKHGFNVPLSAICRTSAELEYAVDKIGFPLIIKPYEKTEKWDLISPRDKILKLHSMVEVASIGFDLFDAANSLLIQQWIPGSDSSVYFCLVYYNTYTRLVGKFTGRKLLQAPPQCGSTAAAIGFEDPEIDSITKRLFQLVGYKGLGSLELKKSAKDGKYYLVEPTVGRNDLQSNVAFSGGVNLTQLALADLVGAQLPQLSPRKGAWIDEEGFIDSLRYYIKKGEMSFFELLPLVNLNCYFSLFSWRDIKPFRKWFLEKIKRIGC